MIEEVLCHGALKKRGIQGEAPPTPSRCRACGEVAQEEKYFLRALIVQRFLSISTQLIFFVVDAQARNRAQLIEYLLM
jgi:hypothetical protein